MGKEEDVITELLLNQLPEALMMMHDSGGRGGKQKDHHTVRFLPPSAQSVTSYGLTRG